MSKESWYGRKLDEMDVVRISDSDDFVVDYDRSRGMYRVSIFKDGHFKDEYWFDAYEDKECAANTIWLKEEDKQRLKSIADRLGRNESEVVASALIFYEDALNAFRDGTSKFFLSGKAWE